MAPGDPLDNAIPENVSIGVERLKKLEPIVASARDGKIMVVGGICELATGKNDPELHRGPG